MTKGEFLQILEAFPGKTELARCTVPEQLKQRYSYVDLGKVAGYINRHGFKLNLPDNQEIWFKFLAFVVITTENEIELAAEKALLRTSQKVAKRICERLNQQFHGGKEIIQDLCGIDMGELIEFARSGEPFLLA